MLKIVVSRVASARLLYTGFAPSPLTLSVKSVVEVTIPFRSITIVPSTKEVKFGTVAVNTVLVLVLSTCP